MKKIHLLGMMMLILSTAFIGCGKVTNDPDPKKDDPAGSLGDTVAIEVTVVIPDYAVLFGYMTVYVDNSILPKGYVGQTYLANKVYTAKFYGPEINSIIGKESQITLHLEVAVNNVQVWTRLLGGPYVNDLKPITLKKGLNKITFEYETYVK